MECKNLRPVKKRLLKSSHEVSRPWTGIFMIGINRKRQIVEVTVEVKPTRFHKSLDKEGEMREELYMVATYYY